MTVDARLSIVAGGSGRSDAPGVIMPASIPKDELFFWTRRWREGEQESAAARAAGDALEFDSGRDAVRWLLSDDER
jgi:hypothetical protein